jgi:membrane protein implicated in regulation of membrane protease activity
VTVFLVIGIVGLAVLVVSLVLGDLVPGAADVVPGDLFSAEVIGAFVAATGFGGAVADSAGAPALLPWVVGIVAGVVFAWFAGRLTRLVRSGGSDATLSTGDTVGHSGRVVSAIPVDGFGSVSVVVGGHTVRLNARADAPLEAGTEVHVTGVLSPTAVTVSPTWTPLP